MRLLIKLLYAKFIIGWIAVITFICMNQEFTREHLPLPVKEEVKKELIEHRKYLQGNPFKIQLWINENIEGKSDGGIQFAQTPEETFGRKAGDCEDYALLARYLLEEKYEEIHIVVWEGRFTKDSINYEKHKGLVIHAVCVFKIGEGVWGTMDNNGFMMTEGSLEKAVRFNCKLRKVEVKRAFTTKFFHYAYRKLKRII